MRRWWEKGTETGKGGAAGRGTAAAFCGAPQADMEQRAMKAKAGNMGAVARATRFFTCKMPGYGL